jgi:hypothetical protein
MYELDRLQRAMRLTEAAARAADKVIDALRELSMDDTFVLTLKRDGQHYRLVQFYGLVLRDLSLAQDLAMERNSPRKLSVAATVATTH